MGSFHWRFVEYKEQNGFVIAFFVLQGTGYNVVQRRLRLGSQKAAPDLVQALGTGFRPDESDIGASVTDRIETPQSGLTVHTER